MTISLPMYDLPEVAADTDALCGTLAELLHSSHERPAHLSAHWRRSDVVLTQTCGLPLVGYVSGEVVGTLAHAGVGTSPGRYRSVVVARAAAQVDGPRRPAVNEVWSLSGWLSLRAVADQFGPFGGPLLTGSHRQSIAAIRRGAADIASIDAVTFALLARHAPGELEGIDVIGDGPDVPELPLITSRAELVEPLRDALVAAVSSAALAPHLDRLLVTGFVPLDRADYDGVAALAGDVLGELPPAP